MLLYYLVTINDNGNAVESGIVFVNKKSALANNKKYRSEAKLHHCDPNDYHVACVDANTIWSGSIMIKKGSYKIITKKVGA